MTAQVWYDRPSMIPASFFTATTKLSDLPVDAKPHIAMVGRSNVGKSSMINHLTGQKNLARVSADPGRTQTINLYDIDGRFFLVDLPGYGYAQTSKEKRVMFAEMIHEYLLHTPQLRLVLLVIDARIPPTELDADMAAWLQDNGIPFIIVTNKMDKLSASEATKVHRTLEEKYPGVRRIEHSITSGRNRNEVWGAIENATRSPARDMTITGERSWTAPSFNVDLTPLPEETNEYLG